MSIRDITVLAGEEFKISVPFIGTPLPKIGWTVNAEEMFPDDRIKFDTERGTTTFTNKCARRSDTGKYTIQLVNSEGSDTASCKVLVVDKPGPPQGPLEITDITPETCSLSWKPPLGKIIMQFIMAMFCMLIPVLYFNQTMVDHLLPIMSLRDLIQAVFGLKCLVLFVVAIMMLWDWNPTRNILSELEVKM